MKKFLYAIILLFALTGCDVIEDVLRKPTHFAPRPTRTTIAPTDTAVYYPPTVAPTSPPQPTAAYTVAPRTQVAHPTRQQQLPGGCYEVVPHESNGTPVVVCR